MYELLYVEINAICMIILLYILYKTHTSIDRRAETVAFNKVVIATLIILIIDIAWMLGDKNPGEFFYIFNCVANAAYLFLAGLISYLWFVFVNYKIKGSDINKRFIKLMALPLIVHFLLCATSPWTKIVFYIDEANAYMRGEGYLLQPAISYSYLIIASLQVLLSMKKEKSPQKRTELATLFSFFILPVIGATLCIAIYGLPTSWPGTTLSLLMVYINFQGYQISTDGLTELNNRRQFDKYLTSVTADVHKGKRLFLFIMDVDDFKSINDTFGHLTGDAALIKTAKLLQQACQGKDAFLARYGGDEFALVYFCEKVSDAKHLKTSIENAFSQHNSTGSTPYKLALSIGFAEYAPEQASSRRELIAMADDALYAAKLKRKSRYD